MEQYACSAWVIVCKSDIIGMQYLRDYTVYCNSALFMFTQYAVFVMQEEEYFVR